MPSRSARSVSMVTIRTLGGPAGACSAGAREQAPSASAAQTTTLLAVIAEDRIGFRANAVMHNPRLQRVCVSSWSFHTSFERDSKDPAKVLMDVLDFPEMVADRYDVHNVEIVLPHFADPSPARIAEFKRRLENAHSRVVNMPLDFAVLWNKPAISSTDPAERDAALALYKSGIDTAQQIGSPTVRCEPGVV